MTLRICSRSKDVIEPLLKPQWYVNMKDMAAQALKVVESGELVINPKHSEADYKRWMENIRDWCISRQLWWGHQAPVYYVTIEGEQQSVSTPRDASDVSQMRGNGGLRAVRKRKFKRKLKPNSQERSLPSNATMTSSTHGSPPDSGPSPQLAGQTTYHPQTTVSNNRPPPTCKTSTQTLCSKQVGTSSSSGLREWSC